MYQDLLLLLLLPPPPPPFFFFFFFFFFFLQKNDYAGTHKSFVHLVMVRKMYK